MSLALLFSPQGSQTVGMGRDLALAEPDAAAVFERADEILGWSVSDLCWTGPADTLNDTRQTQPCLLTTSLAALRALEARGPLRPAFVAGHSVGEYAALVAAGVLSGDAALRLVARRGALMGSAGDGGGMAAVIGLERDVVQGVVDAVGRPTQLVVANDNAPGQVVISGMRDVLREVEAALREAGARRVIALPVSGAFHSPLMAPVAEELASAFTAETWHDALVPVVSNVTAEPHTDADRIRTLLTEQVRSPVEWVRSIERLVADGVDTFVEVGAGSALVNMVRRIAPRVRAMAVNDAASLDDATRALGLRRGATVGS